VAFSNHQGVALATRAREPFINHISTIINQISTISLIYQPVKVKSGKSTESSLNGGRGGGGWEMGWGSVAMTPPSFEPDRSPAEPVPQGNSLLQPSPIPPRGDRQ
jgi:hypothetical protein